MRTSFLLFWIKKNQKLDVDCFFIPKTLWKALHVGVCANTFCTYFENCWRFSRHKRCSNEQGVLSLHGLNDGVWKQVSKHKSAPITSMFFNLVAFLKIILYHSLVKHFKGFRHDFNKDASDVRPLCLASLDKISDYWVKAVKVCGK